MSARTINSRFGAGADIGRVFSREECEAIGRRVLALCSAKKAQVRIQSVANAGTDFARGDTHLATDTVGYQIGLQVELASGQNASIRGVSLDDAGLMRLVRQAEAAASEQPMPTPPLVLKGPQSYPQSPTLFFESVPAAMPADRRAAIIGRALDAVEAAGLTGAGSLSFALSASALMNTEDLFAYECDSYGEVSLTARTTDGTGSGWAWGGFEDWARVDPPSLIARAVDLAKRSANPVAVEPGRYTVILEPAAVATLVGAIRDWSAVDADQGQTIYSKEPANDLPGRRAVRQVTRDGNNKIGLQIIDRRLQFVSDPWDADLPQRAVSMVDGSSLSKVTWFERGVLKTLAYDREYAEGRHAIVNDPGGGRFTTEGPAQTLEQMIGATKRGIWVNRLSNVSMMDRRTLLLSGTTRDGTFLIENGKITKAIKNLRFSDSPLSVLNQLEAWGDPVRASSDLVVPRLKVRDFNFTSLTDAI